MGSKGSSAPAARELTQTELDLLKQQEDSLKQASDVAAKQYNLSVEDREYVAQIYRGDLDPNSEEVQTELAKRMADTPKPTREEYRKYMAIPGGKGGAATDEVDTGLLDKEAYEDAMDKWEIQKETLTASLSSSMGTKGVDELLFEGIVSSESRAGELLNTWKDKSSELGGDYVKNLTGISDSFKNTLQTSSDKMGTADTDIYAQTKATNLAGISQAYQDASKEAMGQLSRRGLAGSGVEANVIGNIASGQAGESAAALAGSYQQAIGLSDQRRNQQMGISGQIAQTSQASAQNAYGIQSGLEGQYMQNEINLQQQGLSNLQMGAGVAGGTFVQSQNYLNQSGQTANQTASIAGSTASAYGQMDNAYQMKQNELNSGPSGLESLAGSALSAGVGAYTGGIGTGLAKNSLDSDERLKTNLVFVGVEAGHNIYTWDWIEGFDGGYNKGVLAQEVLETNPEAVEMRESGYYAVDYDMIGVTPEAIGV